MAKSSLQLALAPMINVTTPPFRKMVRLISPSATLYTEMVTPSTIFRRHGRPLSPSSTSLQNHPIPKYLCSSSPLSDHNTIIQLGGSQVEEMAQAALRAHCLYGATQFNINVGCPSNAVQSGDFGAMLMKDPHRVALIARLIRQRITHYYQSNEMDPPHHINISVKCRVGVDEHQNIEFLHRFLEVVSVQGQVKDFIIHARHGWLKGLSPKQNRHIPPLEYDKVYQTAEKYASTLNLTLNGGILTAEECKSHLNSSPSLAGFMIGRKAFERPQIFADLHREFVDPSFRPKSTRDIAVKYLEFLKSDFSENPFLARPPFPTNLVRWWMTPLTYLYHGFHPVKSKKFKVELFSQLNGTRECPWEPWQLYEKALRASKLDGS